MKKIHQIGIIISCVSVLLSCKKDPPVAPTTPPEKYENGVLVLNEGLFGQNNASMTFYGTESSEAFQQVFKSENDRGLGDTANDMVSYSLNGKEYVIIAVDVSSQVEIVERYTLKSVAQIPLFDMTNAREPRRVVVREDRAFVCNYDGTVAVINLNSYTVESLITVGDNPDGMVIVEDRLYVSNSGGLHYPVYDSTVSVIDLTNLTLTETFKTRINCTEMVVDAENEIYLVSNGNHGDIEPALLRIDATTNAVLSITEMGVAWLALYKDWMYYYDSDAKAIKRLNTLTEEIDETVLISTADYANFYGLEIDSENERIYCVDANGYVNSSIIKAYSMDGSFLFSFSAGLNATDFVFNNQ